MTANEGSLVGQTLGVYRLRALLGVGGMAEVYLAEDPSLRRDIAVKVLPRSLAVDPNYIERFRNEAQRVASLSHPNITPVYSFGEERGLLYLVMPRLKESLRERMEREGILPVQEAARITNQIAAALYIAHQHGIVHRDVKPENILLDESGKAMLTDFGIARELATLREAGMARTLAATGLPVGTPEYMAPEQLRGLPATEQVDLYALGVVLYEMLTARVPHDAATPYEVATAVLRDRPAPPSRFNSNIPPAVERVILLAMEKDLTRRYHTMKEFALALREAITNPSQPINSGALRWTHYAPADGAGAAESSGPKLGKSLASATSSLILAPQIPLENTTKRPTIGYGVAQRQDDNKDNSETLGVNGLAQRYGGIAAGVAGTTLALPRILAQRRSSLLLGAVALLALVTIVTAGLKVSDAFGLFSNSVGTPSLIIQGAATATTEPTAIPTVTPAPTATARVITITPTASPAPPLSISPSTVTFTTFGKTTCAPVNFAPIIISNLDTSKVTWRWTTSNPSLANAGFQWSLNSATNWKNGLPSDSRGIAAYDGTTLHTDTLYLRASCSAFQNAAPFTVTMTDVLNRSYTIKLQWGN